MTTSAYGFLGGFLSAAFLLRWWQLPHYPWWLWLTLLGLGLVATRKFLPVALGISLAVCAVMRTAHIPDDNTIDSYANPAQVTIEGTITAEPDRRPLHTKYTVSVDTVTASGSVQRGVVGNVLVSDYRNWPRYEYGDRIRARGMLELPGGIDGFRYDHYLSRFNVHSVMYRSFMELTKTRESFSALRVLYRLKERLEQRINRLFPEPHASFMAGLLTGSRKGIPENVMADFNATGLTHIIAISGYNITIIIAIISGALFWLPPSKRLLPAVVAICMFTIFVGAGAAVVRAAIMGILGRLALHTKRLPHARLIVLWTALFMIVWNPKILWYDAGFQLSFLAVIGLLELSPWLDPLFQKVPNTLGIRESLQMTIAAQLSAVPLIIVLFGRVSLVAPLANVLVAPLVPLAMLFGTLALATSYASMGIGQGIALLGWQCLTVILFVAKFCANLPLASLSLSISPWALSAYYLALAFTIHTASRFWCRKATVRA